MISDGDARVLLVWLVCLVLADWLERWLLGRRSDRETVTTIRAGALASQARFLDRVKAMRAAAALEEMAAETERLWQARDPSAPQPLGIRLTGTDPHIAEQLIQESRAGILPFAPRRSEA